MPIDKDMYRTVTIRFSLLNQEHVRLLEQMEQECRSGSRESENACGIRNNGRKAGRTDGAYRYRRD